MIASVELENETLLPQNDNRRCEHYLQADTRDRNLRASEPDKTKCPAVMEIGFHEAFSDENYIPLSIGAMQEVGEAAQTLGGLYRITSAETFAKLDEIAHKARLPKSTCKRHLKKLEAEGWIKNCGRQKSNLKKLNGRKRRTTTIKLTTKAVENKRPYAQLPWWGGCHLEPHGRLTWSQRAVLAVVASRYAQLVHMDGHEVYEDAIDIEELGGPEGMLEEFQEKFKFSISKLMAKTGLSNRSVIKAKMRLNGKGIIQWISNENDEDGYLSDILQPSPHFHLLEEATGPRTCRLSIG